MYEDMTEAQATEYEMWKERLTDIARLREGITEYDRAYVVKGYGGDILQPAYDRVERLFEEMKAEIEGRMNELNADYCLEDYEAREYYGYFYREEAEEALISGINFVAICEKLCRSDMESAMRYISDKGLASLNYKKTCEAIEQFKAERYSMRRTA